MKNFRHPKMRPYCRNVGIQDCNTDSISFEDLRKFGYGAKYVKWMRRKQRFLRRVEKKQTRHRLKDSLRRELNNL